MKRSRTPSLLVLSAVAYLSVGLIAKAETLVFSGWPVPQSASEASEIDSLDFRVNYSEGPFRLSKAQLVEHLPDTLKKVAYRGESIVYTQYPVFVLPFSGGRSIEADTTSELPEYLMVLFGYGDAVLVILKRTASGYMEHWKSGLIEGSLGGVRFTDINNDGAQEFVVQVALGAHGYDNVYIYSWHEGDIQLLSPSGEHRSVSEFSGRVHIEPSDSGTVITAGFPSDTLRYTYFIRNGTNNIELVAKTPKEKQECKVRHPPK